MAVMAEGFVLGAAAAFSHETLLEVFDGTDAKIHKMFEEFAPRIRANNHLPRDDIPWRSRADKPLFAAKTHSLPASPGPAID